MESPNTTLPTDFKKLMIARFFFTFATAMQAVAIGWRMYELTGDPLKLGFIGLAEAIPALSLALYAGYFVDHHKPLPVYRAVLSGSLLSGLVLLVSQLARGHLTHDQQVIALYVSSVITGTARAFSQPSTYAIVPRIVPREALQKAAAWMASALQVARIGGPAIGGLIFGYLGIAPTASVVCCALALAILSTTLIRTSPAASPKPATRGPAHKELLSGAAFVYRHPYLFSALFLDMISVMFGGVTAMLPVYAATILFVGAKGLGILRAAPAIGAALTSLFLTRLDIRTRAGHWLLSSVAGFGLCILVFSVSHDFAISALALALSGAFDSISMVIRSAAVQLASPDEMRGRISAVNSIFIGSSNELGEFESGVAAHFLGLVPSVVMGAGVCLATVATAAVASPALRKLNLKQA